MNCTVCSGESHKCFNALVLNKYNVDYYKCSNCGFMQTEEPYWLPEAYSTAITSTDIGLLARNIDLHKIVYDLIAGSFNFKKKFLDYGGGYGILVRLLRDKGLDFYRQDIYCENIFAINHDIENLDEGDREFELLTCFEVFEHTNKPHELLAELGTLGPNILISTLLQPSYPVLSENDWWYISPHTGQHVSFYTLEALSFLAKKHNFHLYSNGGHLHLFTRSALKANPLTVKKGFIKKLKNKVIYLLQGKEFRLESLVGNDVDVAKGIKR